MNRWANIGRSTPWTVILSMNHREPTTVPRGTGQALPRLALLLLPVLALSRAWSRPNLSTPISPMEPAGYLALIGAPPLRFQDAIPPPDLVMRPPGSAPPKSAANEASERPDVLAYTPPPTTLGVATIPSAIPSTSTATESAAAAQPATPPPILRDELQRQAHPEDVLPYFQIPAAQSGDANLIVPGMRSNAPAPLPQSSATYTQSPR
jgi:hypothetical protein